MFALSKECSTCYGTGIKRSSAHITVNDDIDMPKCDWCDGIGANLTDAGKELLEFLEKFTDVKVKKL